jgi:hypothetical protein
MGVSATAFIPDAVFFFETVTNPLYAMRMCIQFRHFKDLAKEGISFYYSEAPRPQGGASRARSGEQNAS